MSILVEGTKSGIVVAASNSKLSEIADVGVSIPILPELLNKLSPRNPMDKLVVIVKNQIFIIIISN